MGHITTEGRFENAGGSIAKLHIPKMVFIVFALCYVILCFSTQIFAAESLPVSIATLLHNNDPRTRESPKLRLTAGELDVHAMINDYKDARNTQTLRARDHGFATFTHTFAPLSPPPEQPRPRTRFFAYTQVAQRTFFTQETETTSARVPLTLNVPVAHRALTAHTRTHAFNVAAAATRPQSRAGVSGSVTSLSAPVGDDVPRQWMLTTRRPLTAAQHQALDRALHPYALGDYVPDNSYIVTAPYAAIARVLPVHQRDTDALAQTPAPSSPGEDAAALVLLVVELHPALKLSPTLAALRDAHRTVHTAAHVGAAAAPAATHTLATTLAAASETRPRDDAIEASAAHATSPARVPRSVSLLVTVAHPAYLERTERRARALAVAHQLLHDLRATATARAAASQPLGAQSAFATFAHGTHSHADGARQRLARTLPAEVDALEYVHVAVADRDGYTLAVHVHALTSDEDADRSGSARVMGTLGAGAAQGMLSQARAERTLHARAWEVVKVMAEHPLVGWVERRAAHRSMNKHSSVVTQGARGPGALHPMWARGLVGRGQVVAVADTGVDHDNCFFYDPSTAVPFNTFNPRHRKIVAYHTSEQITPRDLVGGDQLDGHGTHTGGTVAGQPYEGHGGEESLSQHRGLVYRAKLAVFDYQHPTAQPDEMVLPDDVYSDYLLRARNDYGVAITSNSWGDVTGVYDSFSRAIDLFSWHHRDFLNFFAVGNTGVLGRHTAASPALAKNVVAVGSSANSPLSFFERGLDAGLRVLAQPRAAGVESLPLEIGVTPAAFGLMFPSMAARTAHMVRAAPFNACRTLTNGASLQGAAVLVGRGSCPFSSKAAQVQRAGGVVMVLVNNDDADDTEVMYPSTSGGVREADYASVAAVMVPQSVGRRLEALLPTTVSNPVSLVAAVEAGRINAAETIVVRFPIEFINEGHHEHRLSAFSSRGPTRDGRIKPDLLAPGEYIVSARSDGRLDSFQCNGGDGSTLKPMQGTSMAAPAAAAAAAMVREYFMKGFYPSGVERSPLGVWQLTAPQLRGEELKPWLAELADARGTGNAAPASGVLAGLWSALGDALGLGSDSNEPPPLHADSFVPSAALMKAMLVHSSVAVAGPVRTDSEAGVEAVPPPPSVYQGYGRIKLDNVLTFNDHPLQPRTDEDFYTSDPAAAREPAPSVWVLDHAEGARERWSGGPSETAQAYTGDTHAYCFDVSEVVRSAWAFKRHGDGRGGAADTSSVYTRHPFRHGMDTRHTTAAAYPYAQAATADPYVKVTLAYTDYPATLASAVLLVNDLDLTAAVTAVPRSGAGDGGAQWASAVFLGNHGADYGGNESRRSDIIRLYNETALSDLFYRTQQSAQPQTLHTFTGHPSDDTYVQRAANASAGAAPLQWDHRNNVESVFISANDILDVAAHAEGVSAAARSQNMEALLRGQPVDAPFGLRRSPTDALDWTLSVYVHGTAVPHGPQPFALVVSTLYGSDLRTHRLLPSTCAAGMYAGVGSTHAATMAAGTTTANTMTASATASPSAAAQSQPAAPTSVQRGSHTVTTSAATAATAATATVQTLSAHAPVTPTAGPSPYIALCPNNCSRRGQCLSRLPLSHAEPIAAPTPMATSPSSLVAASRVWGCACDAEAAGADCSASASPLAAMPSTLSVASASRAGMLTALTLSPGDSKHLYVYVPPRSTYPVPAASDPSYAQSGLTVHILRTSAGGDADYYLLTPPVDAAELVESRHADTGVSTSPTYAQTRPGLTYRLSPFASGAHALAHGGWPSERFYSHAQTMCDDCYDDLLGEALADFALSSAGGPQVRVTQKLVVPYRDLPRAGGYLKLTVYAQCCNTVSVQLGAALPGATLNAPAASSGAGAAPSVQSLGGADVREALQRVAGEGEGADSSTTAWPSAGTAAATMSTRAGEGALEEAVRARIPTDTHIRVPPLARPEAVLTPRIDTRTLSAAALSAYLPLQKRAVITQLRLKIDLRVVPDNMARIVAEEVSALLGIDDGPCRVVLTDVSRVPASTARNEEESVAHLVDAMGNHAREAHTLASSNVISRAAPGAAQPPSFAALLPADEHGVFTLTDGKLDALYSALQGQELEAALLARLGSARPLQAGHTHHTMQRSQRLQLTIAILPPPSVDAMLQAVGQAFDPALVTQPRQLTHVQQLLLAERTTCSRRRATHAAQASVDRLFSLMQGAFDLATPSNSFSVFGASQHPDARAHTTLQANRSMRTLAMPAMLPLSSLVLTQVDPLHRPPYSTRTAQLCADGTYALSCAQPFSVPAELVNPYAGIARGIADINARTDAAGALSRSGAATATPTPAAGAGGAVVGEGGGLEAAPERGSASADDDTDSAATAAGGVAGPHVASEPISPGKQGRSRTLSPLSVGLLVILSLTVFGFLVMAAVLLIRKIRGDRHGRPPAAAYRRYPLQNLTGDELPEVDFEHDHDLEDPVARSTLLPPAAETSTTPAHARQTTATRTRRANSDTRRTRAPTTAADTAGVSTVAANDVPAQASTHALARAAGGSTAAIDTAHASHGEPSAQSRGPLAVAVAEPLVSPTRARGPLLTPPRGAPRRVAAAMAQVEDVEAELDVDLDGNRFFTLGPAKADNGEAGAGLVGAAGARTSLPKSSTATAETKDERHASSVDKKNKKKAKARK